METRGDEVCGLLVNPKTTGSFRVQYRQSLSTANGYVGTPTSGTLDQQGWPVQTYTVNVVLAPAPQILSFTASPTQIIYGDGATLSWSSKNASYASLDDGVNPPVDGLPANNSMPVYPLATTTYVLRVTGPGGQTANHVKVSVSPTPACYKLAISADPAVAGNSAAATTPTNCPGGYLSGTQISIVATPGTNNWFNGWTQVGNNGTFRMATSAQTTFTITGPPTLVAHFILNPITSMGLQYETSGYGAYVYSVPFGIKDPRFKYVRLAETVASQGLVTMAMGVLFEGPGGWVGVVVTILNLAAKLCEDIQDLINPVYAVPVANDLATTNGAAPITGIITPTSGLEVSAIVFLDFVDAPGSAARVIARGEPLELTVGKQRVTLLTASEIAALASSSQDSKSFLVIPKWPFKLANVDPSRVLLSFCEEYVLYITASIGVDSTFSRREIITYTVPTVICASTSQQVLKGMTGTSLNPPPQAGTSPLNTTVYVQTLSGGASAAARSPLLTPVCTIDVTAKGIADGKLLAKATIPAQGFQTTYLGVLPATGWFLELVSTCDASVGVTFSTEKTGDVLIERVVPIVLDVSGSTAHYTTEVALVNRGARPLVAILSYQASSVLGSGQGSGAVTIPLAAGEQRVLPNVIYGLRDLGLAIPETPPSSEGGTLYVTFSQAESDEAVAVIARTTTETRTPQPAGSAGLSYSGSAPANFPGSSLTVFGLRSNDQDRSNVAIFNPSPEEVTVRVTAFSGDATGISSVITDGLTMPAFGWVQYSNPLASTGIQSGWFLIEKVSGKGAFGAYGVINDNVTNDGSFVEPVASGITGSRLTVPVLVETAAFRSELVLANRGSLPATLTLNYVESQTPSLGAGGTATITLRPQEQRIIPQAIDWLRSQGLQTGAQNAASYVGVLRITVSGASLSDVYAGARTATPSPAGGQFGLFTPGVYEGQEASIGAYLYGLRADVNNRSNVAVENSGPDDSGTITLELRTFDGDAGGAEAGSPQQVTLAPGQFKQFNNILAGAGIQNGWVWVRLVSGTAPWIAYGVINDGGNPGERTGDGAYVPMTAR